MVRFANDKDMDLSGSAGLHHAGMALHYQGGAEVKTVDGEDEVYKVEYYYTDVPLLATPVTEEYEGTSYTLNKPDTSDDTIPILAVNPDLAAGAPGKYSYLTNLIFNDLVDPADPLGERTHINFTVTSKRSFMDTKDLLGNVTIITLLDWDNSTIGQLVVPKRKDVRGLVSDYVAENLIYHDTDDSAVGDNDINDPAAAALRDGTPLDVFHWTSGNSYRLKDGTDLLHVQDYSGPENSIVVGQESYNNLSKTAQGKVSVYFRERGLLYSVEEELEKSYAGCRNRNPNNSVPSVGQDITPVASSSRVMYFLTTLNLPVYGEAAATMEAI